MESVNATARLRDRPAAASGDEFSRWAAPHVGLMGRLAARLAPIDERDDIVQEALTRAWVRWSTFDLGRGSPAR